MSDERINSITSVTTDLNHYGSKVKVEFNGSCLKKDKIKYTHGTIVNMYIVYEISKNINISSYPTFENILSGTVSLIKNVDIDEYKYSGYDTGFDRKGTFSVGNGFGRNSVIFWLDMSCFAHVDSKKKDI